MHNNLEEIRYIYEVCKGLEYNGNVASKSPFDLPNGTFRNIGDVFCRLCTEDNNPESVLPCENSLLEGQTVGYRKFISMLIYLDRFLSVIPNHISTHNVAMLMYVSYLLVDKYSIDESYKNSDLASILNLNIKHLNRCEVIFLNSINFNLRITNEEYVHFCTQKSVRRLYMKNRISMDYHGLHCQ